MIRMPQNKLEKTIFTAIVVLITVPCFVTYCMSYENGGILNLNMQAWPVFVMIELVLAFLSAEFIGNPLAERVVFKVINPRKHEQIITIAAITCATAFIMCVWMSFLATILYHAIIPAVTGAEFDLGYFLTTMIPMWLQTIVLNFPFALLGQLFVIQPLSRQIFRKICP